MRTGSAVRGRVELATSSVGRSEEDIEEALDVAVDAHCDVLCDFPSEQRRKCRQMMIDLILCTDLAQVRSRKG